MKCNFKSKKIISGIVASSISMHSVVSSATQSYALMSESNGENVVIFNGEDVQKQNKFFDYLSDFYEKLKENKEKVAIGTGVTVGTAASAYGLYKYLSTDNRGANLWNFVRDWILNNKAKTIGFAGGAFALSLLSYLAYHYSYSHLNSVNKLDNDDENK